MRFLEQTLTRWYNFERRRKNESHCVAREYNPLCSISSNNGCDRTHVQASGSHGTFWNCNNVRYFEFFYEQSSRFVENCSVLARSSCHRFKCGLTCSWRIFAPTAGLSILIVDCIDSFISRIDATVKFYSTKVHFIILKIDE